MFDTRFWDNEDDKTTKQYDLDPLQIVIRYCPFNKL